MSCLIAPYPTIATECVDNAAEGRRRANKKVRSSKHVAEPSRVSYHASPRPRNETAWTQSAGPQKRSCHSKDATNHIKTQKIAAEHNLATARREECRARRPRCDNPAKGFKRQRHVRLVVPLFRRRGEETTPDACVFVDTVSLEWELPPPQKKTNNCGLV